MVKRVAPVDPTGIHAEHHPHCWVCSESNPQGLTLRFEDTPEGIVVGRFPCEERYTGYPGCLHGGIVSALLDGAMTHCLLLRDCPAFTADLQIRFLHPVAIGRPAVVRAWVDHIRRRLHVLRGELLQDDRIHATAVGKFMRRPQGSWPEETP